MAIVAFFTKTPATAFAVGLDFTDELQDDVTLVADSDNQATARVRKTEVDATSTILAAGTLITVDVAANTGKILISGGTRGVWYEVFFTVVCSDGNTIPGKIVLFVDE